MASEGKLAAKFKSSKMKILKLKTRENFVFEFQLAEFSI